MFYEKLAEAKQERDRIYEEMLEQQINSPTMKQMKKLRDIGYSRLDQKDYKDPDTDDAYHEYKQKLKPAELRKAKALEKQLEREERPFMARLAKLAEAKEDKKRKGYMPELAALGTVGLGGTALSRLKVDPAYIQKRKNVLGLMHQGTSGKGKLNQEKRKELGRLR